MICLGSKTKISRFFRGRRRARQNDFSEKTKRACPMPNAFLFGWRTEFEFMFVTQTE